MKSIAELEAIKKRVLDNVNLRQEREEGVRVVVGMATCGIAAGARPVLNAFNEEIAKRGIEGVMVGQTGCIGICQYEPVCEIFEGETKTTYVKLTPEKVERIVVEHLVGKTPVTEFTIGAVK